MTDFDYLNLEIPLILAVLIFMSSLKFMLSCVEHEKSFITLGPHKTQTGLVSNRIKLDTHDFLMRYRDPI